MAGAFKKACFSSDTMDYGFLLDYEFQKDQPFEKLCSGQVQKKVKAGQLDVVVPTGNLHVKKLAKGVVGYHFVAVLLYGNPAKKSTLRTEVEESKVYGFDKTEDTPWRFSFVLPNKQQPWMVMLGITCDVKLGTPSPAYCRMKVIAVSR
jgi:hypothetical protein